jgi:hypothetical protein
VRKESNTLSHSVRVDTYAWVHCLLLLEAELSPRGVRLRTRIGIAPAHHPESPRERLDRSRPVERFEKVVNPGLANQRRVRAISMIVIDLGNPIQRSRSPFQLQSYEMRLVQDVLVVSDEGGGALGLGEFVGRVRVGAEVGGAKDIVNVGTGPLLNRQHGRTWGSTGGNLRRE